MSKIRQAVNYERQLANAEVKAHRELVAQALKHEREMAKTELKSAVAARNKVLKYERKLTDSQFETLSLLNADHQKFHEREHIFYENAVEKASASLKGELHTIIRDVESLEVITRGFMSTGRFEREHQALIERMDEKFAAYDEKIVAEEKVTIKQSAQADLSDKIATSNRWLIGVLITVFIFGTTTLLHALGVI